MINLIALHGKELKLPKGWDAEAPNGCWLTPKPKPKPSTHWFNTEDEAMEFAHTLDWWLVSKVAPRLWRVEEMDGYR